VVAVAVAVALVVVGLFIGGVWSSASGIPLGSGTASISWKSPATSGSFIGEPSDSAEFNGSVSGSAVAGAGGPSPESKQSMQELENGDLAALPAELPELLYVGRLGGTAFSTTISIRTAELSQAFSQASGRATIHYDIAGSYGKEAIAGTVTLTGDLASRVLPPGQLELSIGRLRVTGTIQFGSADHGGVHSATAMFDVAAT
jgi:hypothetical protein